MTSSQKPRSDENDVEKLPPVLTVEECAAYLRVGRSAAYELARTGQLPALRLGRSLRIPRSALLAWVEASTGKGRQSEAVGASWQGQPAALGFGAREGARNGR